MTIQLFTTSLTVIVTLIIIFSSDSSFFIRSSEASKNFRVSTDQLRNVRESGRINDTFSNEEYLESKKLYHKIQEELKTKQKLNQKSKFFKTETTTKAVYSFDFNISSPLPAHLPVTISKSEIHDIIIKPQPAEVTSKSIHSIHLNINQSKSTKEGGNENPICNSFQKNGFITGEQSPICRDDINGVVAALTGACLGLLECTYQFQFERWNCSVNSERLSFLLMNDLTTHSIHGNETRAVVSTPDDPVTSQDNFVLPNENIRVADLRVEGHPSIRPRNAGKSSRKRKFRRSMKGFLSPDVTNSGDMSADIDKQQKAVNKDGTNVGKRKKDKFVFLKERGNHKIKSEQTLKKSGEAATKETAFIYAITSAGVAYAITESCSAGNLTDCSCLAGPGALSTGIDNTRKPRYSELSPRSEDDSWKWGGCSDNIEFGLRYAERFTDVPEKMRENESIKFGSKRDLRSLVNLHNNEVGRKVLFSLMKMKCRCHGVSGSCGVRTCWRSLPNFREVGDTLKKKYESSVEISPKLPAMGIASRFDQSLMKLQESVDKSVLLRREKRRRREPISDTELVYVEKSPNYCKRDPVKGVSGTKGRICRRDSYGPESCEALCCGRGYRVEIVKSIERCNCKFVWCCTVQCRTCEKIEKRYTCR